MSCPNYGGNNKCELREPSYQIPQKRILNMCTPRTDRYTQCPEIVQMQTRKPLRPTVLEMRAVPISEDDNPMARIEREHLSPLDPSNTNPMASFEGKDSWP